MKTRTVPSAIQTIFRLMTASACFLAVHLAAQELHRGQVFYATDFEATNDPNFANANFVTGFNSSRALAISRTAEEANLSAMQSIDLAVGKIRGCKIAISAMVKAANVSPRPNSWNGVKLMAVVKTPAGTSWPQATFDNGTFDWRRASFLADVPNDATSVMLCLGLEKVSGNVWFDDVKVSLYRAPLPAPSSRPAAAVAGQRETKLRGAMVSPDITEESLRVLGREWNANLIRWQLVRHASSGKKSESDDYDTWMEGALQQLDAALPACEKYKIHVVVDLHSPPGGKTTSGGYAGSDEGLFASKACQEKFVALWRRIAARYKNSRAVWAFDLANEPVENAFEENCDDWPGLAERAARAIREVDPGRTIIVEPAQGGNPAGLDELSPLPLSNIIYSVHMYLPHAFTHQGVLYDSTNSYPGVINGKAWDKTALESALQPAVAFQNKYGVQIYIGEFSAIRWAPGDSARNYLSDVIGIFEGHGWDWSYHAFREWSGWSVEHDPVREHTQPAAAQTSREKLLRDWFAKNQKTEW